MSDPVTIGLGIAALSTSAAATGYQIYSSEEAKNQAAKQAAETKKQTTDALTEQENKRKQDEFQASQIQLRDEAKKRQRALAAGSQGRAGTILTSPLGVPQTATAASKTLLGS